MREPAFLIYAPINIKRFVLHPGMLNGKFYGVPELIRLYGVSPRECIVTEASPFHLSGGDLVHLYPASSVHGESHSDA